MISNKTIRCAITLSAVTAIAMSLSGCEKPEETAVYRTSPVERRDIVVAVEAAGVIEPFLTVEVKSKASGEILKITGQTGDVVEQGTLLVAIDKRSPRNQLAQAQAELEAATARRSIAKTQSDRARKLFESRTINEVDYEQTILEFANAKAEVIRSEVSVENARIALDDTSVRAPISGTIIDKLVETGQVISSPTMDVGGGTLLLKMADLSSVQVKTMVDETDIGKIQPNQPVTVTVTAYPNQPFTGRVSKIEPKAMDEQTVTTFSVLIVLDNKSGLLKPGMNADVEIKIAERLDVVAVPTVALRTRRDIAVTSQLVGIAESDIRDVLEAAKTNRAGKSDRSKQGGAYQFSSLYWVVADTANGPRPVAVTTGLTDLDYSEVIDGLETGVEVTMLPSSGLIQSQEMLQQRMRSFMSMPGMGGGDDSKKKSDKSASKPDAPSGERKREGSSGRPAAGSDKSAG